MIITSLCISFPRSCLVCRGFAHRAVDELDLLHVVLCCKEFLRRGAIANWCEHVLAHAIRHFSLEKILLDHVFLDENFFERVNGGVSSDALPNRLSSTG